MSFDLFLVPARVQNHYVDQMNPFTGEVNRVRPPAPLTESELNSVRSVLRTAGTPAPDEFGFARLAFGGGGSAEVSISHLETGCCVSLRGGLSPDCLKFLCDLLSAAEWVMFPTMEGNPAIVASPGVAREFTNSFPEVVCRTADELRAVLSTGYGEWKAFRDQVVAKYGDGGMTD